MPDATHHEHAPLTFSEHSRLLLATHTAMRADGGRLITAKVPVGEVLDRVSTAVRPSFADPVQAVEAVVERDVEADRAEIEPWLADPGGVPVDEPCEPVAAPQGVALPAVTVNEVRGVGRGAAVQETVGFVEEGLAAKSRPESGRCRVGRRSSQGSTVSDATDRPGATRRSGEAVVGMVLAQARWVLRTASCEASCPVRSQPMRRGAGMWNRSATSSAADSTPNRCRSFTTAGRRRAGRRRTRRRSVRR
jgi:hypothetical protein